MQQIKVNLFACTLSLRNTHDGQLKFILGPII